MLFARHKCGALKDNPSNDAVCLRKMCGSESRVRRYLFRWKDEGKVTVEEFRN